MSITGAPAPAQAFAKAQAQAQALADAQALAEANPQATGIAPTPRIQLFVARGAAAQSLAQALAKAVRAQGLSLRLARAAAQAGAKAADSRQRGSLLGGPHPDALFRASRVETLDRETLDRGSFRARPPAPQPLIRTAPAADALGCRHLTGRGAPRPRCPAQHCQQGKCDGDTASDNHEGVTSAPGVPSAAHAISAVCSPAFVQV